MELIPRHIEFISGGNTYDFRIDQDADVPFRRISESLMAPRADISGAPGAINLQRDVWLWSMSDFVGGEGRLVFDSSDPLGPPTFKQTDGGVDVRTRGEFSLHPDEKFYPNETGGGSTPTVTTWTNVDLDTVSGSPTYSGGASGTRVVLAAGDEVQAPARTPGAKSMRVSIRCANAFTKKSNPEVTVLLTIRNTTDSVDTATVTATQTENQPLVLQTNFTAVAGKTYRYRVKNNDTGQVTTNLAYITEEDYATGPVASNDVRDLRLGVGDHIWALNWDGTNTDVLKWDFTTSAWTTAHANVVASVPRGLTGSDQYMYSLHANGRIYRFDGTTAVQYTADPATAGFDGTYGEPLSVAVANNRLYALFQQGLFEITLDMTAGLPLSQGSDYVAAAEAGEFYKELDPDTDLRQHMCSISNGVRFFTNVRGEQATIWEFSDGSLKPTHFLPTGYVVTAIRHYANITFIAALFTNSAAAPAETRTAIYFISSDNLLRFLGYLRFWDTNSQQVAYISSYGHDVYFFQGRRIWRYNLGTGGLTLENVTSQKDETKSRAIARMDKKFWAAVEGEGVFVADNAYPQTTMYLYSPLWDFDVPDLDKVLLSLDIDTRPLPANTRIDVEYIVDDGEDWTSAGTITTTASTKTRLAVSTNTSTVTFRNLGWRVGLTSIDGVDTPRVLSVTPRIYVLEYEDSWDMTVLCDDDDSTSHPPNEQRSGRQKANDLWAIKSAKAIVQMKVYWASTLPTDADTYSTVAIEDPFQEITEHGQSSMRFRVKNLA